MYNLVIKMALFGNCALLFLQSMFFKENDFILKSIKILLIFPYRSVRP
jgi:hypothetical protein